MSSQLQQTLPTTQCQSTTTVDDCLWHSWYREIIIVSFSTMSVLQHQLVWPSLSSAFLHEVTSKTWRESVSTSCSIHSQISIIDEMSMVGRKTLGEVEFPHHAQEVIGGCSCRRCWATSSSNGPSPLHHLFSY